MSKIKVKSLRELLGINFFVPSYQRGYRWTTQQVKELLEDLNDFTDKSKKEYEFYCLQPIVVKPMTEDEKKEKELPTDRGWFEVIDGQQRLTTLLLILHSFKDQLKLCKLPTEFYEIRYERELLSDRKLMDNWDEIRGVESDTIDRLHLTEALLFIKNWADTSDIQISKFCDTLLQYKLDRSDPPRDIINNVRIIWYESTDENPVEVFTRLNIGKISLTNSELIKALFLNSGNYQEYGFHIKLRQQEIGAEWDKIEATLQDESFWYFLSDGSSNNPTRIDFIFDLIKDQNILALSPDELHEIGTDDYSTFRYFYTFFSNNEGETNMNKVWDYVKKYFKTYKEWYDDIELYHYLGYLLYFSSKDVGQFVKLWDESDNKKQFKDEIKKRIFHKIEKNLPITEKKYKCQHEAFNLLLFHNIQTSINQNKVKIKDSKADMYRFPFNFLKKEKWDVEHINSNTTNKEDDVVTKEEWLVNVYLSMPKEIQKQIDNYFENRQSYKLELLFEEVKKRVPQISNWTNDDKNMVWNYTLLDCHTNRSYGNAIFSSKRRIIIDKDSGRETQIPQWKDGTLELNTKSKNKSTFVPPVTKQIFLKYYSPMAGDNNYWDKNIDAQGYLEDMQSCINNLKTSEKE